MPDELQDANVQQSKPADLQETREVSRQETPLGKLAKAGSFEFLLAIIELLTFL